MDASKDLFPRHLKPVVEVALADTPVVCLVGPRQCGKTTLARQLALQRAFFSLDLPPDGRHRPLSALWER